MHDYIPYNFELHTNEYQVYQYLKSYYFSHLYQYKIIKHFGDVEVFVLESTNYPKIEFDANSENVIKLQDFHGEYLFRKEIDVTGSDYDTDPWFYKQNFFVDNIIYCKG